MTTVEAAKLIGCSVSQVKHLIRIGRIQASKVDTSMVACGYTYDVLAGSAERYRDTPKTELRGFPRGHKRGARVVMSSKEQIDHCLLLLEKFGYSTKFINSSFKKFGAKLAEQQTSVRDWLKSRSKQEISSLITQLTNANNAEE